MIRKIVIVGMTCLLVAVVLIVAAGLVFPVGPVPEGMPTAPPEGPEWINLLDSAHRGHWENITDNMDIFEIQNETLHIYGKTVYPLRYTAYTGRKFSDFELHLEYKLAPRTNSGLFLRADPNNPVQRGFEIQILDDHGRPPNKNRSGAIYDVASPMFNMSRPAGKWNSYDIRVTGPDVTVRMNGWLVLTVNLDKLTMPVGKFEEPLADLRESGMIALQDHGGEAWFRNFYIKPLNETEPSMPQEPVQ